MAGRRGGRETTGKGTAVAVLDRVRGLVERLSPHPVCDDCIARALDLSPGAAVAQRTRDLAGTPGFERRRHASAICASEKTVTGFRSI